jgi:DNA adenine methylase
LPEAHLKKLAYFDQYAAPEPSVYARPFLKWAGGKSQLLNSYELLFPPKFSAYFEPFVGAGAVFFRLARTRANINATISDCNWELINCYKVIRASSGALIKVLKTFRNDEEFFYLVRSTEVATLNNVERAARMIYLNKTCFNGLYRVNRKGQFNVPFGKYKNPKWLDEDNLHAVSKSLSAVNIIHAPFQEASLKAKEGDFVYFDPPYVPLTNTASFTSYTENSFALKDQEQLANCFRELADRGCLVMLSNSDTKLVRSLYKGYQLHNVKATRAINCHSEKRGQINELVVTNYKI